MTKQEFILRFMAISGQKLRLFKKVLQPFFKSESNVVEVDFLLSLLSFTDDQKKQFSSANIGSVLKWLELQNHHLVLYSDPTYPELLRQISAAPLVLFVIGNVELLSTPQIAMVGSRQFSHYGAHWAKYFAAQLSLNGMTITSGLALGIDALSHRGALEANGLTLAVLGSGLNQISPRSNLSLAAEIIKRGGALVSEFFPDEVAKPEYFPRRNRIISGLSLGTFVVEASEKSGSLITARYAIEQNRDVFALPSDVQLNDQSGTHALIKQGAYLVSKPDDILSHYQNALNWIQNSIDFVDAPQIIHLEVFSQISKNPIPADQIAEKLQAPITEIMIKLVELELEGLITTVNGGYIRL